MKKSDITSTDDTSNAAVAPPALKNHRSGALKFLMTCGVLITLAILTANIVVLRQQFSAIKDNNREHLFFVVCSDDYPVEERSTAFMKLVRINHVEWRSALLDKVDLSGANVAGASLKSARIREANLRKANFSKCDMTGGSLAVTNMTEADFSDAKLAEVNLFKAVMDSTDFTKTNFAGASLSQARAHGANFMLAEMPEADLLMVDFTGATLTGANLTGANLEAAIVAECDLALARLEGANIVDTDFTNSNWWRARGLTGDQQLGLIAKYPPSGDNKSRKNDFDKWLESLDNPPTN